MGIQPQDIKSILPPIEWTSRAVQSAKSLLKKTKDDGTDFYLALLSWRNTAATNALGSPSQRLMSRQTRSKLPVMGRQLRPVIVKHVTSKLKHLRNIKKKHYDKSAKPLAQLKGGQTVRMQTTSGYDTKGKIVELANRPRSYLVKSCDNDRVYERNRRHLLPVRESPTLMTQSHSTTQNPIRTSENVIPETPKPSHTGKEPTNVPSSPVSTKRRLPVRLPVTTTAARPSYERGRKALIRIK